MPACLNQHLALQFQLEVAWSRLVQRVLASGPSLAFLETDMVQRGVKILVTVDGLLEIASSV